MPVNFIGDFLETNWIETGFYSLDRALRTAPRKDGSFDFGYPLNSSAEVFAQTGVGKTAFCLSLAAIIASKLESSIVFVDLEGQSKDTTSETLERNGFTGDVHIGVRDKGKKKKTKKGARSTEEVMQFLLDNFRTTSDVAVYDSLSSSTSNQELEGQLGDANMGKAAKLIGDFVAKYTAIILESEKDKVIFLANGVRPNMGFVGNHTPGGKKKEELAHLRFELKRVRGEFNFDELGGLIEGKVKKNRYGYTGKTFHVFFVAGKGLHRGLSAMFDCVLQGKAELKRKSIYIEDQSYGRIRDIIKNKLDDEELFTPFYELVKEKKE